MGTNNSDYFDYVEEGNNDPSSFNDLDKKDNFRSKKFVITVNNYSDSQISNIETLCKSAIWWAWCKEVGPECGTPHIHGYFEFAYQRYRTGIKKFIGGEFWSQKGKGSKEANLTYIKKDGLYWTNIKERKEIKTLKISELYPFQKSIIDIYNGPVIENKIHVFLDPEGQCGKTEMVRYMFVKYGIPFSYGGKCADIINLIFNNKTIFLDSDKPCMIYNFGRDTDMDKISYKSLEQVSDGCISNTKFEAGCFVMNKPHVFVLCNSMPLLSKLTASRWIIYDIINKELIARK